MGIIFCENTQALFHQITFGELVPLCVFSNCVLNIAFKKALQNCAPDWNILLYVGYIMMIGFNVIFIFLQMHLSLRGHIIAN